MAASNRGPLRERRDESIRRRMMPGTGRACRKDQVAEILVFRQQQPIFAVCASHDLRVDRARRDIGHVNNVLPGLAQERSLPGAIRLGRPQRDPRPPSAKVGLLRADRRLG